MPQNQPSLCAECREQTGPAVRSGAFFVATVRPRRPQVPSSKKRSWHHFKGFRQALERSKGGVAAATFQAAEVGAVHA